MNNSKLKCNFKLFLLSTYRTELMGMAMLGVLIGHLVNLGGFDKQNFFVRILMVFPMLCFTQTFLFLSGIGIYKSLTSRTILSFYLKRIQRVFLPSIAIILPFNIVFLAAGNFSLFEFLSKTCFVSFWIMGNDNGMWYISVSLLLYLLAPLFSCIIKDRLGENRKTAWGGTISRAIYSSINTVGRLQVPRLLSKRFFVFFSFCCFSVGNVRDEDD